ncbi:MAG: tripartite tricarboxylate transporter substrate binding protein [Burkholderiaceae bacterium]
MAGHLDSSARGTSRRSPIIAAWAIVGLVAAAIVPGPAMAMAQDQRPAADVGGYPARPVKLVVNFQAGGPLDTLARVLAEKLAARLGQPFVVENKPGAGGNIGAESVAKGAADGYALLMTIDTAVTINPSLYKPLPFRVDELRPLAILSSSGLMIGARSDLGVRDLAGLLAKGKAGALNFSSAGNGSPGHIASTILQTATGIGASMVSYRGNAPAVMAVASGEVDAGVLATPGMLPQVKAGKIVPIAVTSPQRSPLAPQTPTVAESGLPELGFEVLYLLMVPAATPAPIAERLRQATTAALAEADVQARLTTLDMNRDGATGAAAEQRLAALRARYARIVEQTGMKLE